MSINNQPIGVFDSGVGGLTVASAIKRRMPAEQVIYYGDTAHLPYGDKSKDTIVYYSKGITKFLLEQQCKVIVIACNSASSNAFSEVVEATPKNVPVLNVIDPVVDYLVGEEKVKKVGVIGTKSTVHSAAYEKKLKEARPGLWVYSMATPMFVPMIEEGFIFDDISNAIIRTYLSKPAINDIDALVLGCTHYPIIKNQILKHYNFSVDIIDSAQLVADNVFYTLQKNQLLSQNMNQGADRFIVSDYTENFKTIARMFFEKDIQLETINIWL